MKKILLIISFAVCQTTSGQQINQSDNRYRSYDVLEKKQVTVKGFDMNGSENRPLTHLRIHGGRQEIRTKNGNWIKVDKPELKKTEGCLRAYDDDMKNFKDITDNLQKSDELEKPGKVIIKDDYDEFIENK